MVLALNQSQQDRIFNKAKKSYLNSVDNIWVLLLIPFIKGL